MYDADPFAARKAVADRQERAAKKKEEAQQAAKAPVPQSDPRDDSPEVKLSTELRERVENTIKMVFILSYTMFVRSLTPTTGDCK